MTGPSYQDDEVAKLLADAQEHLEAHTLGAILRSDAQSTAYMRAIVGRVLLAEARITQRLVAHEEIVLGAAARVEAALAALAASQAPGLFPPEVLPPLETLPPRKSSAEAWADVTAFQAAAVAEKTPEVAPGVYFLNERQELPRGTRKPEEWRVPPALGDTGYEVSDRGRVRSYRLRGGSPGSRAKEPRVMKIGKNGMVHLSGQPQGTQLMLVAALVLDAFGFEAPTAHADIAWHDGNKQNNHLDNLHWAVPKESK